jgi:predicted DNA binding protein
MREYVFTVDYDHGVDPVMDVFIEYPGTVAKSISIAVAPGGIWRVDRITGEEAALDELETAFFDPTHCNECVGPREACSATRQYQTITDRGTTRTVYSHYSDVENCHSVPRLASEHFGGGLLFDAQRRGSRYEWRFLAPSDRGVGPLFDAMNADLPDGVSIALQRISTPAQWGEASVTIADLPYAQREALETAVGMGYYETPRDATLADIADALDVPESTCRYRLRRAEAWLTTQFVAGNSTVDRLPDAATAVEATSD